MAPTMKLTVLGMAESIGGSLDVLWSFTARLVTQKEMSRIPDIPRYKRLEVDKSCCAVMLSSCPMLE